MKPNYRTYHITKTGQVYDTITCRKLERSMRSDGHFYVQLKTAAGNRQGKKVAVMVAETYVEKPAGAKAVFLKDGDKRNICPENIEWITLQESGKRSQKKQQIEKPPILLTSMPWK